MQSYKGVIEKRDDGLWAIYLSISYPPVKIDNKYCTLVTPLPTTFKIDSPVPCIIDKYNARVEVRLTFPTLDAPEPKEARESIKSQLQNIRNSNNDIPVTQYNNLDYIVGTTTAGQGMKNGVPIITNNQSKVLLGKTGLAVNTATADFKCQLEDMVIGGAVLNPNSQTVPSTMLTPTQTFLLAIDKNLYRMGSLLALCAIVRKLLNG